MSISPHKNGDFVRGIIGLGVITEEISAIRQILIKIGIIAENLFVMDLSQRIVNVFGIG